MGAVVFAFGLVAAVFSILSLGLDPRLNTIAYDALQTPAWMLNQIHQGILGFFRPELVSCG
jgi:uncharacterized membrane protein